MGLSLNFLMVVTMGHKPMRGLALCKPTEDGTGNPINFLMGHVIFLSWFIWQFNTLNLKWVLAHQAILLDPAPHLPYFTPIWITSLWNFLSENKMSLELQETWDFVILQGNCYPMDISAGANNALPQSYVNWIWLFLLTASGNYSQHKHSMHVGGNWLYRPTTKGRRDSTCQSQWHWPQQHIIGRQVFQSTSPPNG